MERSIPLTRAQLAWHKALAPWAFSVALMAAIDWSGIYDFDWSIAGAFLIGAVFGWWRARVAIGDPA